MNRPGSQPAKPAIVPVQMKPVRLLNPKLPPDQLAHMTALLEKGAGIRLRPGKQPVFEWKDIPPKTSFESLRIAQLLARKVFAADGHHLPKLLHMARRPPLDFVLYEAGVVGSHLGQLLASDMIGRYARHHIAEKHIPALRLRAPGFMRQDPNDVNKKMPTREWTIDAIQPASLQGARVLVFTGAMREGAPLIQGLAELTAAYNLDLAAVATLITQGFATPNREKPVGKTVPLIYFFESM